MNFGKYKSITVKVLIGENTKFEGNILSEDAIKVDGEVVGNIVTTREVIVGEQAVVLGDIQAASLVVAGTVTGNVKLSGQLSIGATGALKGNVKTASMVIEDGGKFHGMSESEDE